MDGKYEFRKNITEKSYTLVVIIYNNGKIVYYNESTVDLKSNLSEEFKEKLKEYQ